MSNWPYIGGNTSRAFGDWTQHLWESNDEYQLDGVNLAARAWDLYRNGPYARAMVRVMVNGILGPLGLPWRSTYQADGSPETSDLERSIRRDLERAVRCATKGKRFDAKGQMSFPAMLGTALTARWVHGDCFINRLSKPNRPDATRDTCAQIIDPARVQNRAGAADSRFSIGGLVLNSDNVATDLIVRTRHPNQIRPPDGPDIWVDVPIYAPSGGRNVLHLKQSDRPDQIRGVSEFSSNLRTLKFLEDITFYWVVAKKIQASQCIVIEVDDPEAAAKKDRNGALLSSNVGIKPGMKYYVKKGTVLHVINTNFQGSDYIEFRNANLAASCAPWLLPYELVLAILTGTNLSASRAAIGQFHATTTHHRAEAIEQAVQPLIEWILAEEINRGFVTVPNTDIDCVAAGRFIAPPKIDPDPYKTMLTVGEAIDRGISKTTAFGWLGLDFETETTERVQNDEYAEDQGLELPNLSGQPKTVLPVDDPEELPQNPGESGPSSDGGKIPTSAVEDDSDAIQSTAS